MFFLLQAMAIIVLHSTPVIKPEAILNSFFTAWFTGYNHPDENISGHCKNYELV